MTSGDRSVTTEGRRGFDSDNGRQICHNRGDLVVTTGADLSLPKGFGKPFAVYRSTQNLGHIQLQMTGSGKPSGSECKPRRNRLIISRKLMRIIFLHNSSYKQLFYNALVSPSRFLRYMHASVQNLDHIHLQMTGFRRSARVQNQPESMINQPRVGESNFPPKFTL